jgi:CelD/BcsL family acetyltransferase involved in cellulose biosynthesis
MELEAVTSAQGLLALRQEWDALLRQTDGPVFQTPEWFSAWWEVFGPDLEIRGFVARSAGRLIGIVPLMIHSVRAGPLRIRRLTVAGEHGPFGEYQPIVLPGYEFDLSSSLAPCFHRQAEEADVLDFHLLDPGSPLSRCTADALRSAGFAIRWDIASLPRVTISLPRTWDQYRAMLSYNERGILARYERALVRRGADFVDTRNALPFDTGLAELARLHTEFWSEKGTGGHFAQMPLLGKFLLRLADALAPTDRVRIMTVRKDGRALASLLVLFQGSWCHLYIGGRDPHHPLASCSPMRVLMVRAIGEAIKRGCRTADFLGGDMRYKLRLGGALGNYARLTAWQPGIRGWKGYLFASALSSRAFLDRTPVAPLAARILRGARARPGGNVNG